MWSMRQYLRTQEDWVSLATVFDAATQESWSRNVMFHDMFSSAN
jgi:hypothetical protein